MIQSILQLIKNQFLEISASPFVTSGLRLGTPAITSRGFKEADARQVADIIIDVLNNATDQSVLAKAKEQVKKLTDKHQIY